MHRLVYEKDGLPNGSEVAYFSKGKVVELDRYTCLFVVISCHLVRNMLNLLTEIAGGLQNRNWNILPLLQ